MSKVVLHDRQIKIKSNFEAVAPKGQKEIVKICVMLKKIIFLLKKYLLKITVFSSLQVYMK